VSLPIITNSRARAYRRCPRFHELAYERGIRPVETSEPLRFGALFHALLEAHFGGEFFEWPPELDPFERARLEILYTGYTARWDAAGWRVEAVEREFQYPIDRWTVAGKIDLIVRLPSGQVWIVEHKTTSEDISPGSPYWQKLRLDSQISTYLEGARSIGYDPVGCIYDVIARPALRPLKATPEESRKYTKAGFLYANQRATDETVEEYAERLKADILDAPDRYYQRGEVVRLEREREAAAQDLLDTARSIDDAQLTRRWPRTPEACFGWNRPCDYWAICTGQASTDSPQYRTVDNIHEELSQ